MDDDISDTHLCLACNQTIVGLMNYVVHKKSECQKRRSGPPSQHQQQQQHHSHGSYSSSQQLFDQTLNVRENSGPSQGGNQQNVLLSAAPHSYGLRSQDNVMLSSIQQPSDFGRRSSGYSQQQNSQNASTPSYTTAQSGGAAPPNAGLSVDVGSPLASFIDSAFSPGDDSPVDPNSVLEGPESPRSRPDFFQSLELKSITGGERRAAGAQGRNLKNKKGRLQEDTLDLDLPITMILSNLDFSSDEEENDDVDFPSEDEESDSSDSEDEWSSPPRSHTGGKWKPGQGPSQKYHPHGPVGGKWKPGQGPQDSKIKKDPAAEKVKYTKPFFCNLCKATFPNRVSYNGHFQNKTHKDAVAAHRAGTTARRDQQPEADGPLLLTLDPATGEFTETVAEPERDASQISLSSTPSSASKKRQYSGPFCETCDLYFDSIKVYDIHCETKTHKENVEKLNKDIQEAMLGPVESLVTGNSPAEEETGGGGGLCDKNSENSQAQASEEKNKQSLPETHFCVVCKKTFKRKYEMARHLLSHFHKQRAMKHPKALEMLDKYNKYVIRLCPFQCNICQFYFNRASDLLDHLQTPGHALQCSDLVGPLLCVTCKYKNYSPEIMLEHVQSEAHKQVVANNHHVCIIKECHSKITCKYCGVQMHSAVRMKRHVGFRHKNRRLEAPLEVRRAKPNKLQCPECNKVFKNRSALLKHYQQHQGISRYKCTICNKAFSELRRLHNHFNTALHERRESFARQRDGVVEVSDSEDESDRRKEGNASGKENAEDMDQNSGQVRRSSRPRKPKVYDTTDEDEALSQTIRSVLESEMFKDSAAMGEPALESQQQLNEKEDDDDIAAILNRENNSGLAEETTDAQDITVNDSVEQSEDSIHLDEAGDENKTRARNSELFVKKKAKCKSNGLFTCEICDFSGDEMEDLKKHYMAEHPSHLFTCEPCDQFFLSNKAYKIHCAGGAHQAVLNKLGNNVKLELHVCPHCSKKFSDDETYELHVEFVHLHISTEEAVQRVCQGRDMVTQLYGEHLRHLDSISHDSSVSCPECGKFFMKNNLIEHLRTHTGERPFKCRHCTRDFGSRMSLRRHLIEHIGKKSFSCETCGKVFQKRAPYNFHMRLHASEKKGLKFDCKTCGASFLLEKQLIHHMKRHGERKFKCTVPGCHWTFVLKNELEQHMITHTKEKKYLCDICGWGAYSTTNLKRHVKTHQPAKEIPCEYCPYKAGCKTHLRRHMRIHIGAKPFKCLYCSYACNTHENMRKHILKTRKHQGLKIYPCKFCDYQSNEAKEFKRHLMLDHIDYVKARPSESLVKFTGLYKPEEDITQPPEGSEIHQVMKGRFIKVYDGTRVGGTGDAVGPPSKKRKVKRSDRSVQLEQEDISEDATSVQDITSVQDSTSVRGAISVQDSKQSSSSEPMTILAQSIVDATEAPVSLVSHQQQEPVTVTIHQSHNIYPRGLPWTIVTENRAGGGWCQNVDVVVPQSIGYRAPEAVQVVGTTAGGTSYLSGTPGEMPTILTMVNVDSQTFQQIEASGYQVIATGGTTITQ